MTVKPFGSRRAPPSKHWGCVLAAAGVAAAVFLGSFTAYAQDDARALVKQVLDAVPKMPLTAHATLTSDRGWARELALSRAFVNDADASYRDSVPANGSARCRF